VIDGHVGAEPDPRDERATRRGALVTNVRPALIPASQLPWVSVAPVFTYTRTSPGGPRSDAKFGKASVPAAAGIRKPQLSNRYQMSEVIKWSLNPITSR